MQSGFFEHGGRLDLAKKLYPQAPEPWIDLSTGISPWSYPAPQVEANDLRGLPDAGALQRLIGVARRAYRVPQPAEVVPLAGSEAGLSVIPWLFREAKRVAVLGPAYGSHAKAWTAAGHSVSQVSSLNEASGAAILIVVNPNNPDGRFLPHSDLAAVLPPLRRRNGLLIVDEAFADTDESYSLLPVVARLDHTLVLRSIGKFFGAGGIRLGFAITSHPIAERLRDALGSWPVSSQALAFGTETLADEDWAIKQRRRLKEAANEIDAVLNEAGFTIAGGTSLFRLGAHPCSSEIFSHLAKNGILVRPFQNRNALRFGLPGSTEQLGRLRDTLKEPMF